jgi:quercetin dioxygenase-like cupin family protein
MFKHEDARRILIEWASGDFKVAKVLIAKAGCVVGDHYHRDKDEEFLLLSGSGRVQLGDTPSYEIVGPATVVVPRGTYHRFELSEGAILLGVGTAEFDQEDEIKGKP